MFNIFIDNKDYSICLLDSPVITGEFVENTLIGNVASMKLSVTLNNNDDVFNFELLSKPFVVKDGSKSIGTFYVLEKPERMTKTLNLELYDCVYRTDVPYESTLSYPCLLKNQLDEMALLTNMEIDYSAIDSTILNRSINFYDNTISLRNHLSMIAEISVCNISAKANGAGLEFVKLDPMVKYEIDDSTVEQFDKIEEFKVSKVSFFGGLIPISKGSNDFNLYRLSDDNMYIDSQEHVDYIYETLKDVSFCSSQNLKIVALDGLRLGNVIDYKNRFKFMVLDISTKYFNGEYNIQEISGKQKTRSEDTIHEEISNRAKIKRLKVITNQNEQSLQIIAKEQDGLNEKFTEFVIDANGIKQEVKETTEKIESFDSQDAETYYYLSTSYTSMVGGSWSTAQPAWVQGKYIWHKTKYTFANGTTKESSPVCVTGNAGQDGMNGLDAVLLCIDSSNGSIFKNTGVATTLTVSVIVAGMCLDTSQKLKEYFGQNAKITWKFKRLGEIDFNPIDESDPRLSDGGFIFTLNPNDIQTKHTFNCELDY